METKTPEHRENLNKRKLNPDSGKVRKNTQTNTHTQKKRLNNFLLGIEYWIFSFSFKKKNKKKKKKKKISINISNTSFRSFRVINLCFSHTLWTLLSLWHYQRTTRGKTGGGGGERENISEYNNLITLIELVGILKSTPVQCFHAFWDP